ncbi:MAG: aconitate hydratase [Candidatus Moranbacteria bacterium]|nr:aconitate hydratase [Candidatus Moranbacteria bacterium]
MSQFIDPKKIKEIYQKNQTNLKQAKKILKRPLTLTEKILFGHFYDRSELDRVEKIKRGKSQLMLAPDRVVMQDATAQMAVLQFISTGVKEVAAPTSIHCDHLVRAIKGGNYDLENAKKINNEVYRFLSSAAQKYAMDYWKPGSGIIHQIVFEKYTFPGGLIIGTDSHTPNAGGMGMLAVGVGGADAVDVMTKQPWELKMPEILGIKLTGQLKNWSAAKDLILYLIGKLTVKGATGKIIEYFGKGAQNLSASEKATITNMGAEAGATTSIFPFDKKMACFLEQTQRQDIAQTAQKFRKDLEADEEVMQNPQKYFDEVLEIDLSQLEPILSGPDSPDAMHKLSGFKEEYKKLNLPEKVDYCLIGSCTNSSFKDFERAAKIAELAHKNDLKLKSKLLITPGSNMIAKTIQEKGFTKIFEKIGAKILTNTCGPCIGQWDGEQIPQNRKRVIVSTFNRNFKARNDGRENSFAFLSSAELAMAIAFAGKITFDPRQDEITNEKGKKIKLQIPQHRAACDIVFSKAPLDCFVADKPQPDIDIDVDQKSDRIELLEPFSKWKIPGDFRDLAILLKVKGKCTTDHISPAGVWLKYRGHLDNISQNMYSGANNVFSDKTGYGVDQLDEKTKPIHEIARNYKKNKIGWVAVADENYGEGSSREHAAMEPRYLGAVAIIAKSFARIAETNLKKQGILPLWLKNPQDWEKFKKFDRIDIKGIQNLTPGSEVKILIKHKDCSTETALAVHTLSLVQIEWIKEGSALNKAAKELNKL